MNLIYYKSKKGNFGDDLNPFIWEKILGNLDNYPADLDFVGIGSILDERLEKSANKKIIFGSGVRDFLYNSENLDIIKEVSFVRGPISKKVTGLDYITDTAYALALTGEHQHYLNTKKKHKVSYIPYFEQAEGLNWDLFKTMTGYNVILPTQNIEIVLEEIAASECIITSAMHGAIVADIFRIPWLRLKFMKQGHEPSLTSELKWNDWMQSVNIKNPSEIYSDLTILAKSSKLTDIIKILLLKRSFRYPRYNLSDNAVFESKISQIKKKIDILINYSK
ncbi:polysaccharide pyruvyl transferase family protein [Epilithonimonas hungarica]|uniref:Succinoglycan biosynthesis protein ExoV n=1 Tax=Epilithonimonas hungarica TaxID=454006 RepID=A0A1G7FLS8_9FLAO|nr:polysaccharide pyruvyl transferase family protein [Epilithonimonas hungarica]SDE76852.1 succinoglycan biosynthesis protein ExoV [Epilithonimonas hungarica]